MRGHKIHLPQMTIRKGDEMQTPEAVAAMRRLYELGWGLRRIAGELGCSRNTVKRHLGGGGWRSPTGGRCGSGRWVGWSPSWPPIFASIGAMPMWCARSWRGCMALRFHCARWSGRCGRGGGNSKRKRGPRCGLRRRRVDSCKSILGRARSRLAANGRRFGCLSPPWAIRAGRSWRCFTTSGKRLGSPAWKAFSDTSAACPRRCCWTTRGRW